MMVRLSQPVGFSVIDVPATLRQIFDAAVAACHPSRVVAGALPQRPDGRIVVVGAGKASAAMAAAAEDAWGTGLTGAVVTRYGHGASTRGVEVIEAQHPLPDAAGMNAAQRALDLVTGLSDRDVVLALLSGGGSALWSAPIGTLSLDEKRAVTRALVLSGASIGEINCVRKHLSRIKGGRLAAAAFPARVVTLAISDVASDDASVIASGPTVGDSSTSQDAIAVLARYQITASEKVLKVLSDPASETHKPGDPLLLRSSFSIIARGGDALAAACDEAQKLGIDAQILGARIEGDARQTGIAHAEIARHQESGVRPLLLLSGGELTVQVSGSGHGGPNREYLLSLARSLQGAEKIWAMSADTDGIDGSDDTAGGWIGPDALVKAQAAGVDIFQCQRSNDSATYFKKTGQEIVTGPTRTNVNDFRAILILPKN